MLVPMPVVPSSRVASTTTVPSALMPQLETLLSAEERHAPKPLYLRRLFRYAS